MFIQCIPITRTEVPFEFKQLQVSLNLSLAITINNSQGQILKVILESSYFSHGHLYVACSWVSIAQNLLILALEHKIQNIVYTNALIDT